MVELLDVKDFQRHDRQDDLEDRSVGSRPMEDTISGNIPISCDNVLHSQKVMPLWVQMLNAQICRRLRKQEMGICGKTGHPR